MKKTYVKPELSFESFELSASIATGCGTVTKVFDAAQQCGVEDGILIVFTSKMSGCEKHDDGSGNICYDNSTDGLVLYTS